MIAYIIRRLVQMVPVLLLITLFIFFMVRLVPGSPADALLGFRATPEAVARVKATDPEMRIEVEAQSLEQVDAAIAAGADIILVDNLPLDAIREAVKRVNGRAKIELSGGVTLDRLPELAKTGANYVSVGALTHSAPAADLSFELEPE